jgi:hypothetical protein
MNRLTAIVLAAALFAALAAPAAEVGMEVGANRSQIYLGESVNLTIKVSGTDAVLTPDLSGIQNAGVRSLGSHSESRSSVSYINGQWKRTSFTGRQYVYELTPSQAGAFRAGPVTLTVSGRTLTAPGPVVNVMGIERQDDVIITLESSRESVLVDEPFEIALSVAMKRLPAPYADADPLDPANPPALRVDYLNGAPIDGLDMPDVRQELQKRLVSQPRGAGFAINDYTVQHSPFDLGSMFDFEDFMGRSPAKFAFERRAITRNGQPYFEYALRFTYVPKAEGSHTFGPAVFKGPVLVDITPGSVAVTRPVFAVGPAITVRVVPPPEEGRPACYTGAIGTDLSLDAAVDAQTCTVGDPLTLTLSLKGNVRLENVQPPVLGAQTNLTRFFRVYDDTVRPVKREGSRDYVYTVRPIQAGTIEFPPVEVAFYDTRERAYRVVRSRPIPLRVNETASVAEDMIIDTVADRPSAAQTAPDKQRPVPAPMTLDPRGAHPRPLAGGPWPLVVLAAAPALYALTRLAELLHRLRRRRALRRRRFGAARRARAQVRRAARGGNDAAARRRMVDALRAYLGDRLDAAASGLTPGDARRILEAARVGQTAAREFVAVFERLFNAVYAEAGASQEAAVVDVAEIEQAIRHVEEALAHDNVACWQ